MYQNIIHPKTLHLERHRWNTSQLRSLNRPFCVGGTPVSWFWAISGVPSDAEKVGRRRLVEFLEFNSICQLKGVPSDGENRVRRQVFNLAFGRQGLLINTTYVIFLRLPSAIAKKSFKQVFLE